MNIPPGLSEKEVIAVRQQFGANGITGKRQNKLWHLLLGVVAEPMFIILVIAAIIYFILGESAEGFIMLAALFFVAGISIYQENRSSNAVEALKQLTDSGAKVARSGKTIIVPTNDIVVNDIIFCEDGNIVPADAELLEAHDFSVNESMLTGESVPVFKAPGGDPVLIFKGTLVATGSCIAKVTRVGVQTEMGKIGKSLSAIETSKTPLQIQISAFVLHMVIAGVIAFFIVWGINYYTTGSLLHGLLHGLTMAMSVLPEEIPVAFSTFLALGAFRLIKKNVIARTPQTVEALGAATIICADKTGTLTENSMQVAGVYILESDSYYSYIDNPAQPNIVLEYAMWSSEVSPFDPMEKSIHVLYTNSYTTDQRLEYKMVHEYPLAGTPPIMTHVFRNAANDIIIAAKGGVESIIRQSTLTEQQKAKVISTTQQLSSQGYRVLAVAKSANNYTTFPLAQSELTFTFLGLIAFNDPPKKNTASIVQSFYKAGIGVKMITGDYAPTAVAIAQQIGLKNHATVLTGNEIMEMSDETIAQKVRDVDVYARMFPEAKLKVVEAYKRNGEIVAMTGDGVNDGPALKAAHIGIAMGQRGTEIAKQAASLILTDDNLQHMVEAVALGRRIYENLKKAIRYIISIHIPIILIVTIPLLFFWDFTDFFNPIHVIMLELIMGPTCSIIFENEPADADSMDKSPRKMSNRFFSIKELNMSIVQGLVITAGCLTPAYFLMIQGYNEQFIRTIIYTILIFSNILLTLVNRSFYYSILHTLRYKNPLVPIILCISTTVLLLSIYLEPVRNLFQFSALSIVEILACFGVSMLAVLWIELYKYILRKKNAAYK
ncbi:MAG TPA: cation-translocating P-type ATPase [Chitinophagales bacterium]|nr:cation-translocating P-type ATPase [Chitinophagales bacterium]